MLLSEVTYQVHLVGSFIVTNQTVMITEKRRIFLFEPWVAPTG